MGVQGVKVRKSLGVCSNVMSSSFEIKHIGTTILKILKLKLMNYAPCGKKKLNTIPFHVTAVRVPTKYFTSKATG